MRRAWWRGLVVGPLVTVGASLVGGCGIQASDVIEAGGPATVDAFLNRDDDVLLFFRTPDGGLSPVIRAVRPSAGFGDEYVEPGSGDRDPTGPAGPAPTEEVVLALLSGPGKTDRAAGLTTALPAVREGATVAVEVSSDGGTATAVRLPLALQGLNATALHQLTCTIAYNEATDGRGVVTLTGQDGAKRSGTCGLAPGRAG
ncbi:hypothetical protein N7925_04325 [Streptomyces sp. CA-278952]|uniref:hypothetical protein n=1 Tax=unclassified Streptomyces TaxID=2593676 RepID=UPI002241F2A2|nr:MULTISPECIES: hypothetical protein [unclassified Streptomyces]UZI27425.1 hypothetical protein OH133_04430 [Streptomyces sp. VB1]WDG27614.1 hypothetical protein N7925_04325 [Streptomyces sp. CA-278952]